MESEIKVHVKSKCQSSELHAGPRYWRVWCHMFEVSKLFLASAAVLTMSFGTPARSEKAIEQVCH